MGRPTVMLAMDHDEARQQGSAGTAEGVPSQPRKCVADVAALWDGRALTRTVGSSNHNA